MALSAPTKASILLSQLEQALIPLAAQELSIAEQAGFTALANIVAGLNAKLLAKLPTPPVQ